ncbi:MAG: heme A synthase [Rhodanobacteraceae bacterium]|nr:MAG: heme A synthase [Rhodanobacteraceae bacterium]
MQSIPLPLRTLAWVACVFAFCVIVFGAFVRLSNAGLSCPDWPTCYGHITWPVKPAAVTRANDAFPNRPVESSRDWREQSHRFLAGTLGVLVLAEALAAVFATRRRLGLVIAAVILIGIGIPLYMAKDYVSSSVVAAIGEALLLGVTIFWRGEGWRRIAVLALAVVCFQALLGMWTVTWLLLPAVVTAHLLGGLLTFALLAWLAWRLQQNRQNRGQSRVSTGSFGLPSHDAKHDSDPGFDPGFGRGLRAVIIIGLVLLSCQIFLGGWTSTNYAALACGIGKSAFPTCLGQWWPTMDFQHGFILLRHIGVDYQGGILDAAARTAIQMVHRMGAVVVFVYLLWLAHKVGRAGMRWHALALVLLLCAQVALGIGNVTLGLPLWIAVAHTGGAALLLFALVALLARTEFVRSSLIAASPEVPACADVLESRTPERALQPPSMAKRSVPDFPQQPLRSGSPSSSVPGPRSRVPVK